MGVRLPLFLFSQANVICIVYSVNNKKSIEKVSVVLPCADSSNQMKSWSQLTMVLHQYCWLQPGYAAYDEVSGVSAACLVEIEFVCVIVCFCNECLCVDKVFDERFLTPPGDKPLDSPHKWQDGQG